ncbi:MAG TPA: Mur ligase family protein, partial [Steroidobacteraceae bacterium]|nr:Mur ligase family protein [Steroidobacteraceae bacterium]
MVRPPTEGSARFHRLADWLAWQETLHPNAIDLGLDRLQRTLDRLGWRRPACPIITVAGTNGKGSRVALAARIVREAGHRVGTFTSPHLLRYNERITIDGVEVADEALIDAFERIDVARGADTLTFFEFNAAAALLVVADARLDAVVLEVGLGGRLDAVNVVDADVALVTSIDLDHCDWLGHDRETIGREKAGVFRAGRPAIFGSRDMPASIRESAQQIGADLQRLGRDFDWVRSGDRWTWRGRAGEQRDLPAPALHGEIQYNNAAAVLAALEALQLRLSVPRSAIERGLQTVTLPGRFQVMRQSSPRPIEWILD